LPGVVHVISLDRTPQRWTRFQADNPGVPARRFPAVDGRRSDPKALVEGGLTHPELVYTSGAIGCALSHASLWRACAAEGQTLTICEDDAVLRGDFPAMAAGVAARAEDAELILWGWNFDSVLGGRLFGESPFAMGFDQARLRESIPAFQAGREAPNLLVLHRALGIPCYSITPKGAEGLLARCFPLRPEPVFVPLLAREIPNNGIDIAMNAAYPEMAALVSFPPLAVTRNEAGISTVEGE
jgi:hypothetical protein